MWLDLNMGITLTTVPPNTYLPIPDIVVEATNYLYYDRIGLEY
jgi:hypothetical protein